MFGASGAWRAAQDNTATRRSRIPDVLARRWPLRPVDGNQDVMVGRVYGIRARQRKNTTGTQPRKRVDAPAEKPGRRSVRAGPDGAPGIRSTRQHGRATEDQRNEEGRPEEN